MTTAARRLRALTLWVLAALVALPLLRVVLAVSAGSGPVLREGLAETVLDVDARLPTRVLPDCGGEPPAVRVLHEAGAHPRLEPEGTGLWLDAAHEGLRQVFRLDLQDGGVRCFTCDEPGNNVRPYPGRQGLVFDTDRHANDLFRVDSEVHFMRRRGAEPGEPSRRLTRTPGPDDHALLAQGGGRVVWSRRGGRGYEVVWAPLQSAHGALLLGGVTTLARGGGDWLAPAEWSPDARALVLLRGNPFSASRAEAIDFGTGQQTRLHPALSRGGAAFSADGGTVVLAGTHGGHPAGVLPGALASVFAPLATRLERSGSLHRGTSLHVGPARAEASALPVPGVDDWGAPTGVSLSADGVTLYLGQRSREGRERIVEIRRHCD